MKFQGDVTNTEHWNKHDEKIDLIIHLAALAGVRDSMLYPEKYYEANVIGTFNIASASLNNLFTRSYLS